jgi:hypothetical protein
MEPEPPAGARDFDTLLDLNGVYVDKTKYIPPPPKIGARHFLRSAQAFWQVSDSLGSGRLLLWEEGTF